MKTNKLGLLGLILIWGFANWALAQESGEQIAEEQLTESLTEEEMAFVAQMKEFLNSLDYQRGTIVLPGGMAVLEVPEEFYYLSPEDSKRVLEEAWGNPPDDQLTLGMLFPSNYTPLDSEGWGVTIDYSEEGYVKDDDAADIDYDDLMKDMKASVKEESEYRIDAGYESIELIGWASAPYYDASTHKLHWAKEIKFGESPDHTLNYNVRVLGRKGVLNMNFIAGMNQLDEINGIRDDVLAIAEFSDGNRYSQFNPSMDKVAAYGIGGLIAGKIAAKTGLLAAILILLKKFWFILFLPFIWLKNLFVRNKQDSPQ